MTDEEHVELKRADDRWRTHVDARLDKQDATLNGIKRTLDTHIETTGSWKDELRPVISAFETMQSGVQTIGKIGDAFSWMGTKIVKLGAVVAAIAAMVVAWKNWPWVK